MAASKVSGPTCLFWDEGSTVPSSTEARRSFAPGPVGMRLSTSAKVALNGDFTLLKYVIGLRAIELESTLGFAPGRLRSGFRLVALAENELLLADDFHLKASTRWSGGKLGDSDAGGRGTSIEELLSSRGQNVETLKAKVVAFFAQRGGNTPAKVLPNLVHMDGMEYPDATVLGPGIRSGVPQFSLRSGVHKPAEIIYSCGS